MSVISPVAERTQMNTPVSRDFNERSDHLPEALRGSLLSERLLLQLPQTDDASVNPGPNGAPFKRQRTHEPFSSSHFSSSSSPSLSQRSSWSTTEPSSSSSSFFALPSVVGEESWRDVSGNLEKMDDLFDASFSSWIRCEAHARIASAHIRRIYRDYEVEQIVNGLSWLVSDWTLGSITTFLNTLILNDLWREEEELQKMKKKKLEQESNNEKNNQNSAADVCSSSFERSSKRKNSSTENINALDLFSSSYTVDLSINDASPTQSPIAGRENSDLSKLRPFTASSSASSSSSSKSKHLSNNDDVFVPSVQFTRNVAIVAGLVSSWSLNFIGEICLSFLHPMIAIQKQRFLQTFLKDWTFTQMNELFLYMGERLDYAVKIEVLKGAKAMMNSGNRIVPVMILKKRQPLIARPRRYH